MKTKLIHLGLTVASAILSATAVASHGASAKTQTPAAKVITRPLSFEANDGQFPGKAKFVSRGQGYLLSLTPAEAVLSLAGNGSNTAPASLRMKLVGANVSARLAGTDELPGKANYFVGNDPKQWRSKVPTFAKVKCEGVYPGVDLVYYGNGRQLEFDFIVAPGADAKQIALKFEGTDKVELDELGNLVLSTSGGKLVQHKPIIYQTVNGAREEVVGRFKLNENREARFEVAAYDRSRTLIIDPVLTYSTYLGGSFSDGAEGVAVDAAGNFYVVGWTFSPDFPVVNAVQPTNALHSVPTILIGTDAFVSKFRPDGSLHYSTYLGGPDHFFDLGNGIVADDNGDAYITGFAGSRLFPTTAGAFQTASAGGQADAFVAKLGRDGDTLIYSTYLGGSMGNSPGPCCGGTDDAFSIAVDKEGNAFVCGWTASTDFPVTPGALQPTHGGTGDHGINGINYLGDAFVTKLNSTGSQLLYSTFLGGVGDDVATDIVVDGDGRAYITGATFSRNFPTAGSPFQADLHGMSDAFVAKVNEAGSGLIYSTYLGGSGQENWGSINYAKRGIAIDAAGSAYVSGETESSDFPTRNALQSTWHNHSAFVTKLTPDGSDLVYSTYVGCEAQTSAHAIAVDAAGNAHVTGSAGPGFPLLNAIQPFFAGVAFDAFVTRLSADGSRLLYSTYLGGAEGPYQEAGRAIAVDTVGNAYVAGFTYAPDFPTTLNAFQSSLADAVEQPPFGGGGDSFVAVIHSGDELAPPAPTMIAPGSSTIAASAGQCTAPFRYDVRVENATRCVELVCDPPSGANLLLPVGVTTFNCLAHDVTGASSSYSFTVTVVDNERPTISCPANLVVHPACGQTSMVVNYPTPPANDSCSGVTVTCNPPSGAVFQAGTTTVNCTARDASGNTASCSFTVTVDTSTSTYQFTGFLEPIGGADATGGSFGDPLRTFKLKSTIPVKFKATCDGSPVLTGVHTFQAIKYSSETTGDAPIDATPTDAATTGNEFRLTGEEWHFNLDTAATGMSAGIWLLRATLSDGSPHSVWVQIK